jgi:hypothetical protein
MTTNGTGRERDKDAGRYKRNVRATVPTVIVWEDEPMGTLALDPLVVLLPGALAAEVDPATRINSGTIANARVAHRRAFRAWTPCVGSASPVVIQATMA